MPEENKEKTLEAKSEETKEETKKVESEESKEEVKKQEPSEEEEEKEIPEKEPPKRFPTKEQTPIEKRIGYLERKLKEKEEEKVDLGLGEDEEEKPVTRRELNQLLEQQKKELVTNQMVDQFIDENPDYKKYGKVMRKYASDPDYANIPIGSIASMIVGEHLDEEANERAKIKIEADKEAEKTKLGGSSKRGFPSKKGVWEMTPQEFEAKQVEVFQKGRD